MNESTAAAGAIEEAGGRKTAVREAVPQDLKRRTLRGAVVTITGQLTTFILRTGSMIILARLLLPSDFGLVGMVAAFTGFLGLFRECGLSFATVQRASITNAQASTLFWINLAVGGLLAALTVAAAPLLATFYREPRLFWITVALATNSVFYGAAAQHRAMLQRNMRFLPLAMIEIGSLVLSTGIGIGMALTGQGYWTLVVMTVSLPALGMVGVWWACRWLPGRPERRSGIRSMLRFGGTLTLNNVIIYLAYNLDKVLLGRFWGAEALGIYGRSYQLVNLPTENLNSTLGLVVFPALSRVQHDPVRVRSFFLKAYGLFLSLLMPITASCILYSGDIIRVFLGVKWHQAAPIFRLMAPTILASALTYPMALLMLSLGQAGRSLRISLVVAPVVFLSYSIGLSQGPEGVAAGFSIAMLVLTVPVIGWSKSGTLISNRDILKVIAVPLTSVIAGALSAWVVSGWVDQVQPAFLRLVVECTVLFGVYLLVLLFAFNQKPVYLGLLQTTGLWPVFSGRGHNHPGR